MDIRKRIGKERLYFDGATGTLLQNMGLAPGEFPETWNLTHPESVRELHRLYFEAGSDIVATNTFGLNALKFDNVEELAALAVGHVRAAAAPFEAQGRVCYAAFDIGPLGRMLQPFGDLPFEEAVDLFARSVRAAVKAGADAILIETMNDLYEAKAAVLAAKENSDLPVFLTAVFDQTGRLMTGATPETLVAVAEGLGIDAVGVNCSLGPREMLEHVIPRLLACAHVPLIVNPNAGLPREEDGTTVYEVGAEEFSGLMRQVAQLGVPCLGGCCGTTPEYIRRTIEKTRDLPVLSEYPEKRAVVTSYAGALEIGKKPVLIGERINPTGKIRLKQALRDGEISYLLEEAVRQQDAGVQILDVNVGIPEIDETQVLKEAVSRIQGVSDLPLQIDTADPSAMEAAMRIYNGKPLVNSVNGKQESMDAVFPLVKKYGGCVIALTLDEKGIPQTAEGRAGIADRIVREAESCGIDRSQIIVDPLAMTVSADQQSANITLESIRLMKERGLLTSLGVSNVSFGLPRRELLNAVFFAMALDRGLDCAIMNPFSEDMMNVWYAANALRGLDGNCLEYMAYAAKTKQTQTARQVSDQTLFDAIVSGMKEAAGAKARDLLLEKEPLAVINEDIVPALDRVGSGFEKKTVFLPQLLMSAEAANAAFDEVKKEIPAGGREKGRIILATVKGDIHDIGKNIVKVLLQNYGYDVLDLGKDVPPETVVDAARRYGVRLIGLSALMTTTVPAMRETIRLLKERRVDAKVVVGGAVLTQEYADAIGADCYARDAMETVRYAEAFFGADAESHFFMDNRAD